LIIVSQEEKGISLVLGRLGSGGMVSEHLALKLKLLSNRRELTVKIEQYKREHSSLGIFSGDMKPCQVRFFTLNPFTQPSKH
jgi:hypothetical protein